MTTSPLSVAFAPTVKKFSMPDAVQSASRNIIVSVYGAWKTGKSDFAYHSRRPLYVAYLDTNPGLDSHLIKSSQVYGSDDIFVERLNPLPYEELTQEEALRRVVAVENLAATARVEAAARAARGEYGGTFVLDGATMLKGYYEKALLGESATLGFRAARGQRGAPSTFDYAKSNARMFDFIAAFVGWPIDVVLTWEGRRVYQDVWEDGKKVSRATDRFQSSRPDRVPYALNAEIETLKVMERVNPADNQSPTVAVPRIRVSWASETLAFDNMVIPGIRGFQQFKELLLGDTVPVEILQGMKSANDVYRANDAGLLTTSEPVHPGTPPEVVGSADAV